MFICFIEHKNNNLCVSNQQTTCSQVLTIAQQWTIFRRRPSKYTRITLTDTPRGIYFQPSSNNTPSIPPYCVGSKRKSVPEERSNEEVPAGIGDDYYFSPLVMDYYLKMIEMSGGNFYINNHTLSQHDCDSNDGDVINIYDFINIHIIYQCDDYKIIYINHSTII